MIAFFTTVGFGASLSLLKVGGPQVLIFFAALARSWRCCRTSSASLLALPLGHAPAVRRA